MASSSEQDGGTSWACTIAAFVSSHLVTSFNAIRLISSSDAGVSGTSGLMPACMKPVPSTAVTTLCERSHLPYLPRGPSASTYST